MSLHLRGQSPGGGCGLLASSGSGGAPPFDGRPKLEMGMRSGQADDDLVSGDGAGANEARHSNSIGARETKQSGPKPETRLRNQSHLEQASDLSETLKSDALLAEKRRKKRSRRSNSLAWPTTNSRNPIGALKVEPGKRICKQVSAQEAANSSIVTAKTELRRIERERSSSITSDYFSSNHNSPIVYKRVAKTSDESTEQPIVESRRKLAETATIYENPAFADGDADKLRSNRIESSKLAHRMRSAAGLGAANGASNGTVPNADQFSGKNGELEFELDSQRTAKLGERQRFNKNKDSATSLSAQIARNANGNGNGNGALSQLSQQGTSVAWTPAESDYASLACALEGRWIGRATDETSTRLDDQEDLQSGCSNSGDSSGKRTDEGGASNSSAASSGSSGKSCSWSQMSSRLASSRRLDQSADWRLVGLPANGTMAPLRATGDGQASAAAAQWNGISQLTAARLVNKQNELNNNHNNHRNHHLYLRDRQSLRGPKSPIERREPTKSNQLEAASENRCRLGMPLGGEPGEPIPQAAANATTDPRDAVAAAAAANTGRRNSSQQDNDGHYYYRPPSQPPAEHLYCGLNTLRALDVERPQARFAKQYEPNLPFNANEPAHLQQPAPAVQLNQPLQTLISKMNERHFYAPTSANYQEPAQEHLYCGLGTLRADKQQQQQQLASNSPMARYKSDQLNQSFHTLVDQMNERHFYQLNSSPSFELPHLRSGQFNPASLVAPSYLRRVSSSSALDSDLEKPPPSVNRLKPAAKPSIRWQLANLFRSSRPLYLLLGLLVMALSALSLAALISNYRQQSINAPPADDKDNLAELLLQPGRYPIVLGGDGTFALGRLPAHRILAPPAANGSGPPPGGQFEEPGRAGNTYWPTLADPVAPTREASQQIKLVELSTTAIPSTEPPDVAARSRWLEQVAAMAERSEDRCNNGATPQQNSVCSARGRCLAGACSCSAGFSGPTCNLAGCPNECSRHGECQLRRSSVINNLGAGLPGDQRTSQLESLGFQSLFGSLARNSICPNWLELDQNQSWAVNAAGSSSGSSEPSTHLATYDQRLEWACVCQRGFTGADCSELEELSCDNDRDDDDDGLIDCEDDDCCSQPVCRDNLMCFKSPEPTRVLAARPWKLELAESAGWPAEGFFGRVRFLIANDSVQSYAQEHLFDRARVAVVRGRVVKPAGDSYADEDSQQRVIVGVRVGVVESAQLGFTLTRNDGFFDLLVNGNEWITLQYHKNAHLPIKRKLYVRAHTINLLEEDVEMWPVSATQTTANQPSGQQQVDPSNRLQANSAPFKLRLQTELHKLVASSVKRDDERKRHELMRCLLDAFQPQAAHSYLHEPKIINLNGDLQEQALDPLRFIVTANSGAFQTTIGEFGAEDNEQLQITYNSALFPPAASISKSTLSIRLLERETIALSAVILHLDIEGQSRRKRLAPLAWLSYHFAWNRRNVYEQKVYGFGELNIRVGYEYKLDTNKSLSSIWNACSSQQQHQQTTNAQPALAKFDKQVLWFSRKVYLEAHHLNHQADVGKWNLVSSNRFDHERQVTYFGSGWSLPYKLAYPPVLRDPIHLQRTRVNSIDQDKPDLEQVVGRQLANGPGSTMFVILPGLSLPMARSNSSRLVQLDATGQQRLLDVPLSILSSHFESESFTENLNGRATRRYGTDDLQLTYNNYASILYISSRLAGRIVQVSLASLIVLNRTLSGSSATAAAEDEIDIEQLCGFGRQTLNANMPMETIKPCRLIRLAGPHSLTLDEERQLLYFVDGSADLVALELSSNQAILMSPSSRPSTLNKQPHQGVCRRADLKRAFSEYRAHRIHGLTWNKADSSLYFIDQNSVFALQQDSSIELMAVGSAIRRPAGFSFPVACFREPRLGLIKALAFDVANDDLLLVHQWLGSEQQEAANADGKQSGRFYLAKLGAGIRASSGHLSNSVLDLHSASATWNPLIARLASNSLPPNSTATGTINWKELAKGGRQLSNSASSRQPLAAAAAGSRQPAKTEEVSVPFIHLSDGLRRVDSIEIRADGSIFVLDSAAHSIRPIVAYSPNEFNLVERQDVNIERLFATNSEPVSQARLNSSPIESNRKDQLSLLIVPNPISNELMEFHSASGLQLGLISANGIKSEFYYRILANNKMTEPDEDDKYDFGIWRLMLDHTKAHSSKELAKKTSASVRLNKIIDVSRKREYELVRSYSGSRFVLQSILLNGQPICELATDYSGVLTTFQRSNKVYWLEFVYDTSTYLLRDMVHKLDGKNWRQLKRIVHDRVFYHYCDLFIVNP